MALLIKREDGWYLDLGPKILEDQEFLGPAVDQEKFQGIEIKNIVCIRLHNYLLIKRPWPFPNMYRKIKDDTILQGFGDKDGKTVLNALKGGVWHDHKLEPLVPQP